MKIKKLTITNVTSYRAKTVFDFDDRINILIGSNGGGKSNLQKIISLTLSKYFIHQYQFRYDNNGAGIDQVDPWTRRTLEQAFPKYSGDVSEQLIEIELKPEKHDVQNILTIGNNLESFNRELSYWERKYESYKPFPHAGGIAASNSFNYTIRNLALEATPENTPAWAFREYLREFFIFLRVANRIPDVKLSAPVFFFSSDRTLTKTFEVQAGQLTEQSHFEGMRSAYHAATGESMNLMQWGAQHFVRLHRRAVNEGAEEVGKTWKMIYQEDPDVKLLNHYMGQLGYTWGFDTDDDQLRYELVLEKDGELRSTGMFSSGEREIVHFLLAMFALNVRDGLILVDEPELHLHPRWQRIFLGLFRDLSPDRNNQFVITTHSPVFVTPETINSVTRIYRVPKKGSSKVALRDVEMPGKENLVRMINSQNNERLFFADRVVLVEGISDRLVFESLVERACSRFGSSMAVEIIEVGGKYNFADYKTVLSGLLTPTVTVADLDYLTVVGGAAIRGLFTPDYEKQWKALTADKKSKDRGAMIALLAEAVSSGNLGELKKFWEFFIARRQRLTSNITNAQSKALEAELLRLRGENVFVLRLGEIEDYLLPGKRSIKAIVEAVSDRGWINRVTNDKARVELCDIVCAILGVTGEQRGRFLEEAEKANVQFSA